MDYLDFLESKQINVEPSGFDVGLLDITSSLFDFQKDIVVWALKKGKAAIFAGTGLGKTLIQLEWAKHVHKHSGGKVLILAPLAVSEQTKREGAKFGIDVTLCRTPEDVVNGINITNYEKLHKFDVSEFVGVVLDESGILKSFTGKMRNQIIDMFRETRYKLACTATPAPNDHMELGNHAEFLGVMQRHEMLATFFVHDGGRTSNWRLKGHAKKAFWEWVASWAVMLQIPSDLGYEDNGFKLPPLTIDEVVVDHTGYIVREARGLQDRRRARSDSTDDRVAKAAEIVNGSDEPWIIWCDLNKESSALTKAIDRSTEITGSHSNEYKTEKMLGFSDGSVKMLVTKPKIAGWGMNWQHCHNIMFVGLSDSFEAFYQAIRRCWRFGQTEPVHVHVVISEREGTVVKNIKRKEADFNTMLKGMIAATQEITKSNIKHTTKEVDDYMTDEASGECWNMMLGDCVEKTREMDDDSIDYIIYSPPFSSLYTYSNSERDMGNCRSDDEFFQHFEYLSDEMIRVLKPGRLMSVHCMNLPMTKTRDGVIGIRDFRGDLIRIFRKSGFIYHSEVCIWKDPVVAMQRTKALGLLHKQLKKDSCMSRQGIPDYLVTFRVPGDNPEPVTHTTEEFPIKVWQHYASPIWVDINPSDTLQKTSARADDDEKHIAPLQLEVIRRALELWTNPGDLVMSPFAGIGSECYEAVKMGRRAVGIELKPSYYAQAVTNMKVAERDANGPRQVSLFTYIPTNKAVI